MSSFSEYLRLPNTMLPLIAVMGLLFGSLPDAALDSSVSQFGFRDLSTAAFDANAQHVCGLGLGFIPTPHISFSRFKKSVMDDTYAFTRRVLIHDYFRAHSHGDETPDECPPAFRIKNPSWMPPGNFNPSANVLEFCMQVTENVATALEKKKTILKSNLHFQQRARLEELSELKSQVFAIADKNLGLTALDTADYKAACLRWLARTHTVVLLSAEIVISSTIAKLKAVVDTFENMVPEWIFKWMASHLCGHFLVPAFRAMPKLHKHRAPHAPIETRPLTGNHCWATQPHALLVAFLLLPLVRLTGSFCKDSDSFIRLLARTSVPTRCLIFSYDVEKLYPSILHGHCLSTVRQYLLRKRFRYTHLVCSLLAIILAENFCEFDGVIYHQHTGFATGVACGSEVANIYLAALESRNLHLFCASLTLFTRYIDDGFGVWSGSEDTLRAFINQLYTGSGLNITIEISRQSMIFLDMEIFRVADSLLTKCYQKPSNAYLYLPFSSAHPPHVWHAFLRGELIRYVKRCSRRHDFIIMKLLFYTRLLRRGYPVKVIRKSFATVSFESRAAFLVVKPPADLAGSQCQRIPLVLTYSKQLTDLGIDSVFRESLPMLKRHTHFRNVDYAVCWRAAPKLGASLVTYRFPKKGTVGAESVDADSSFLTANSSPGSQSGFHLSFALSQPGAASGANEPAGAARTFLSQRTA